MTRPKRETPESVARAAAPAAVSSLEQVLANVEADLAAISLALQASDTRGLDAACERLNAGLARMAAGLPLLNGNQQAHLAPLRERLSRAASQLASQREALARASSAFDRAASVLVPSSAQAYGADGQGLRAASRGALTA